MLGMATNRMQGSNNSTTAESNSGLQDHAVTASDRTLLITLTATVSGQLGTTSRGAMPVHFLISSGAVTLVGTVSTADESQRILARVQQTPGVLSVFNDLHVGTPAQTASAQTSLLGATTDHAFSPKDQSLLTAVQQAAGRQLGVSGASAAQMPVHFSIENGVVGVTGQVSSLQEKQALLAAVQRTPGVVRVADNVTIANVAAGGVNGALPATSRDLNQSNSIFLNQTNSSGF
jgi:osmotically-inducible protein OsmY